MLALLKGLLKGPIKLLWLPTLYFGAIITAFISLSREAAAGLFLLAFFLPLPNVWYKLFAYPMGHDFIDLLFFSVLAGIYLQKKAANRTQNLWLILVVVCLSYLELWNSSLRFSLPMPVTLDNWVLADWKNYAEMVLLYFLSFHAIDSEDKQKKTVVLMGLAVLLISVQSLRDVGALHAYNEAKRMVGPFRVCHLDANYFGAFIAYYCIALLGVAFFDTDPKRKTLFWATALTGIYPLFASFSRGAYIAYLAGLLTLGLVKKRKLLLVVVVVLIAWKTILPSSVVDRISMTESANGQIEASAEERLVLWKHAEDLFKQNPVFGIGFGGFALNMAGHKLRDTHNFYMRTLSEGGLIGLAVLLIVLYRAFLSGWRLFHGARSDFLRGLGFGFMGCIVTVAVANVFGDRWTPLPVDGYIWILWGMVDRARIAEKEEMPLPELEEDPII